MSYERKIPNDRKNFDTIKRIIYGRNLEGYIALLANDIEEYLSSMVRIWYQLRSRT